ncbi:MAG: single-stranded-DNA-specific exonuclease RecJ [Acidobacteriota bacterium]|nr:single-stranded-DNA-specific exonuclease RecJ [Acidobacteriota bacterium]
MSADQADGNVRAPAKMIWQIPQPTSIPNDLQNFVGGHALIAERLARCGITDVAAARAFLDPNAYAVTSPFELPDMAKAVERLQRAIKLGESILIWGDFDVDGQTATTLLFTALRDLGANVQCHVPLRDGEGHGINLPKLREWLARDVKLIITCDTGITSHEAVNVASAAGTDVIITDHHLLGDTLPAALAVINPMRLPVEHKLRELPGVAVAYQLIAALSSKSCDELLDLVALGIIADVAEQVKETRYLLQRGLATMRASARPGLLALLQTAEVNQLEMDESDIGFKLAPRLNAQGRMGDAADSVELLSTLDAARAADLAYQLEQMNARRRLESQQIEDSAHNLIEREPSLLDYAAIVLSHPDWKGGVAGIVANRLADAYHKPVVLLCEQNDAAFGSARSVAGINITDALKACREKLTKFGGHAMAAGLSLRRENIFEFRRMLSRTVRAMVPAMEAPTLAIDGYVSLKEITREFEEDLRRLAPFGNGNPSLVLATKDLRLVRKKKLGRKGDHLELIVEDGEGIQQRVMWWNVGDAALPTGRFDLAYNLRLNRFKDEVDLVLEFVDLQARESEAIEVSGEVSIYEIEDCRSDDPQSKLAEVLAKHPDAIVWREADLVSGCNRTELKQAETLIVWTSPPGPDEWNAAMETVKPRRIMFFGQLPTEPTLESFLQRLGGLLKFVMNSKGGETTIQKLAAATAQRADAVRYGLNWFQQSSQLEVKISAKGRVSISRQNTTSDRPDQTPLEKLLNSVLAETVAYRKNWKP